MNVLTSRTKLRVYLSSTYQDLVAYRREVDEALRKLGFDVVAMELYTASDSRPLDKCLADVEACDLYIGIFAWRYGFIPPGHEYSITELEYRAAVKEGKERLIFLARKEPAWPPEHIEQATSARITRLRGELEKELVVGYFSSADELAKEVAIACSLVAAKRHEAEFNTLRRLQIEADQATKIQRFVVNTPPIDVAQFVDREDKRQDLHDFVDDPSLRLIKVVGRSGIGKSALVSCTLGELEFTLLSAASMADPQGPAGLLYLGARTTGLSLERIQSDVQRLLPEEAADDLALAWASHDAAIEQKVQTLLSAMMESSRIVVVLDALDEALDDELVIREPGLRTFVDACIRKPGGPLLIVTSGTDFHVPPETLHAVHSVHLEEGLDPVNSAALLRSLDPQDGLGLRTAPSDQLETVAHITGGIPRALELFVGILQRDPTASLERLLADKESLEAQTFEELVAEGYRRLGDEEQTVMQALAVFTAPVPGMAIAYLLYPWHPGIDVDGCLRRLVSSHFAKASRRVGGFALQAPDREHAYREIPDDPPDSYSRTALELRAADYFASIRKPPNAWRSLTDVKPQQFEIEHCCRAGAFDRALAVLQPIDEHHLALWGHYNWLTELRESLLDKPVRAELHAANLAGVGAYYQVFGRYEDAVDYFRRAVAIAHEGGDDKAEVRYLGNLGRAYRNLGDLDQAVECLAKTLNYYEALKDDAGIAVWSDRLALAYWYLGRLGDAFELGKHALALARKVKDQRTEAAALSNLGLMHQTEGRSDKAGACFTESVVIARQVKDRRGEAICIGREGTAALADGDAPRAVALHTDALELARKTNERREQSIQLIGLGWAQAAIGDLNRSAVRLREARDLDVPSTSFLAALRLGLVLLRSGDQSSAAAAFNDSGECCRERLSRCDRLFAARYALGTALAGQATCTAGCDDLVAAAAEQYRRAMANCPGQGIIRATHQNLDSLRVAGGNQLDSLSRLLTKAMESIL